MSGILITLEGGEGCGKSTQILKIKEYLTSKYDCIFTREPGGIEVCEKIRSILLSKDENICKETEVLLFSAARAQLVNDVILPALQQNKIVVVDRFCDSMLAYQGYAREGNINEINGLNNFATRGIKPDLTLYFSIDPEVAFARKGGMDKNDRMEQAGLEFHKRVKLGFDTIAKNEPNRVKIIDATMSIEEVFSMAKSYIDKTIEMKYGQN